MSDKMDDLNRPNTDKTKEDIDVNDIMEGLKNTESGENGDLSDYTDNEDADEIPAFEVNISEKNAKKSGFNLLKNKKFKYGGFSLLFSLIFVTVIVLINVIFNTLLERFDVEIDLTKNKLFSIEEGTAKYLKTIDDEISIIIANEEADFTGAGTVYQQVNAIAKRFTEANSKISIKYVNLLTNPAFSGQYGGELNQVSIVIESKNTGRYKVLTPNEYCVVTYYSPEGQELSSEEVYYYEMLGMQADYDVSAAAEQAFMSAILSVSDVNPVRVAFASGFGEGEIAGSTALGYSAFEELLAKNAYVTETVDLMLAGEIDPDIDFLIIFAPSNDYGTETLSMIDKWLDNNGQFGKNLIYVSPVTTTEMPNLDSFLADWGIRVEAGGVFQTDANHASSQTGLLQNLKAGESDFLSGLENGRFIGDSIRPLTMLFETSGNMELTPLLTTYDGAVIVPMDADENWSIDSAEKGVLNAAIESKKMYYKGTDPFTGRVIAFGGPYIFDASYLNTTQLSNAAFYMNIFNVISGKEEGVTLRPKSFSMTAFEINAQTSNTIGIIFAVVLPLCVVAAGITVFVKRRYR